MSNHSNIQGKVSKRKTQVKYARASKYIEKAEILPGTKVVLAIRVSSGPQDLNNNLADQEKNLRRFVAKAGGIVVDFVSRQISGTKPEEWLDKAAELARFYGEVILAESVDRFVRPDNYHSVKCPNAQPTKDDFERLRRICVDVRLMTILDPDAEPEDVRAYQTRRRAAQEEPQRRKTAYAKSGI